MGNAGQKKRESSLRKSADSKSGPNFGAGVFSTGQKRVGASQVGGDKKVGAPPSSGMGSMMGTGFTSDRTTNSARSQ